MKKVQITIEATLLETREEQGLMLHTEIASGKYGEGDFRLIQSASGTITRMEHMGLCLDIITQDLGLAMLEAMDPN